MRVFAGDGLCNPVRVTLVAKRVVFCGLGVALRINRCIRPVCSCGVSHNEHRSSFWVSITPHHLDDISSCCAARIAAAALSPMLAQGAMVWPVVTRGMMDPSTIRRPSMP